MIRSPKYKALSHGAKLAWFWILSEVAMSSTREAYVSTIDATKYLHVKPIGVLKALHELVTIEWIQIVSEPQIRLDKSRVEAEEKLQQPQIEIIEKQESKKPIPRSTNFEDQFDQSLDPYRALLKNINPVTYVSFKSKVRVIQTIFESSENFASWLNDLWESDLAKSKPESHRTKILAGALQNLLKEHKANS